MNKDSWATEGFSLQLTDTLDKLSSLPPFRRSEDKKGHDVPMGTRFPKNIARWVTKIKEVGPYETGSDVIRDAVWLGLQVLSLRYKEDPEWQIYLQLMKIDSEVAFAAGVYDEEDKFADSLEKFCNNGAEQHAIELLEEKLILLQKLGWERRAERKEALLQGIRRHRLTGLLEKVKTT